MIELGAGCGVAGFGEFLLLLNFSMNTCYRFSKHVWDLFINGLNYKLIEMIGE